MESLKEIKNLKMQLDKLFLDSSFDYVINIFNKRTLTKYNNFT
jgi:hypothetical protein